MYSIYIEYFVEEIRRVTWIGTQTSLRSTRMILILGGCLQ